MKSTVIPNFENYLIYEDGRVFSIRKGIFLKSQNNGNGYRKVIIFCNKKTWQVYIHQLVAQAFIPNTEGLKYIDHIDRNKENNHVSNLRWVSAKENTNNNAGKPRYSASRLKPNKYSSEKIEEIRSLYRSGMKVVEISTLFNIPRQSVSRFIK